MVTSRENLRTTRRGGHEGALDTIIAAEDSQYRVSTKLGFTTERATTDERNMPKKKDKHPDQPPILVPIDFSPSSEAVLKWAAGAARRYQAPLLVLHVVHDLAAAPGYYHSKKGRLRRLEEGASEMMKDCLRHFEKKYPELEISKLATTELVVGLPVNRILEVAEKSRASQIVIGSQGRTGLPHLLLGSKAERVAQLARVPVTIVKAEKPPKVGKP